MGEQSFEQKIFSATKWSTTSEIAAKLVTPITNIILARILAPEAFGVIATVTMIISFAEMFTDSGFQKYLVQREFSNKEEMHITVNVAFWSNLGLSLLFWLIIFIFRENIATIVGNSGLGNVLGIACLQLPLTSFSSIQMALFRREFDFKTLFLVRIIAILIPFFLTIPLAILGFSYWSLIIGSIVIQFSNAVFLTIKSNWRPQFSYNFQVLRKMIGFSLWSLIEAISIWLSIWVDTFVIGSKLNAYYLGIYKTSTTMVNSLTSIITGSIIPVLFPTLARLQNDNEKFTSIFLKFQRVVSLFVLPLGVGVFLYSDLATKILLGGKWGEASSVIGIWAITRSIKISLGDLCSEVYRAKGKPKLSFFAQLLHLIVLIPTCLISVKYGFWTLVLARSLIQLQFVLVHIIIMRFVIGIKVFSMIKNIIPIFLSAIAMGIFGCFLKNFSYGIVWDVISILLCIIFYFLLLLVFPTVRYDVILFIKKIL